MLGIAEVGYSQTSGRALALSQNLGRASSSVGPSRTGATRGEPGRVVDLDRDAAERRRPDRRLELAPGSCCRKRCSGSSLSMPITEFVVAGHADIGHVGGAARQHAVVGGRHMGVGADHQARAAVEM